MRKITKPHFRKLNHWRDKIFSIINENILQKKVCSPYPLCIIKKIRPISRQKLLPDFSNFSPKFFGPKLAKIFDFFFRQFWDKEFWPIFSILAQNYLVQNWPKKVGMGNKLYLIKCFHLLLKKFYPFSDFTFERRIFLRLVGETTWQ